MLEKIKEFVEKIKKRYGYNKCYNGMEKCAWAAMGNCAGFALERTRKEHCTDCPYFIDINKTGERK